MIRRVVVVLAVAAITLQTSAQGLRQVGNESFDMVVEDVQPTEKGLRIKILVENLTTTQEVFLHHEPNQYEVQDFFFLPVAKKNRRTRNTFILPIAAAGTMSAEVFFSIDVGTNPGLLVLGSTKPPFEQVAVSLGPILKARSARGKYELTPAEWAQEGTSRERPQASGTETSKPHPTSGVMAAKNAAEPRVKDPTSGASPVEAVPIKSVPLAVVSPRPTLVGVVSPSPVPVAAVPPRPAPLAALPPSATPKDAARQRATPNPPLPTPESDSIELGSDSTAGITEGPPTIELGSDSTAGIAEGPSSLESSQIPSVRGTPPPRAPLVVATTTPRRRTPAPSRSARQLPSPVPPGVGSEVPGGYASRPMPSQPRVVFVPSNPGDPVLQVFIPPHPSLGRFLVLRKGRAGKAGHGWSRIRHENANVAIGQLTLTASYPHQVWSDGRTLLYLRWNEEQNGALVIQVAGELIVNSQWASYDELLLWLGPGRIYPRLVYQGAK